MILVAGEIIPSCMNSNTKIVGRNPRSTVLDLKGLSDAVTKIITTIGLVGKRKVMDAKYYVISHGQATDTTAPFVEIQV